MSPVIETALQDPLIIVLGLFVVGVGASRVLFRNHPIGRATVRVVFLIILTAALLYAGIAPYRPLEPTGTPLRDVVHAVLKIAWWLWAAWLLVGLVRALVIVERRPHQSRLMQDLLAGLVYLAALFAIVAWVLGLPVQGLLATSGVIAIILGLALQSTLGDVFSGIVLSFSHPYRPGDWISIEGGTEGRVIETNWRATHILTAKRDLAIVPNSTIAKSRIVNASSPSGIHGATISVQVGSGAIPSAAAEPLRHAVLNCRLILEVPAPSVTLKSINAGYNEFDVTFFVEDLGSTTAAQNELYDLIYRHLGAAGIDLAPPPAKSGRGADPRRPPPGSPAELLLGQVAAFATLTPAERAAAAERLKPRSYDQGDILYEPGTVLQSLSIIASGVVSCTHEDDEFEAELARLGPAEFFGELGLLTDAAARVCVTALTTVTVYELAKDGLAGVLAAHPEVAEALHRSLASRQALINPAIEPSDELQAHGMRSWFSDWLHHRYGISPLK